jgi:LmbE family N-acetylglucosaminyl deacetylase
LKEQNKTTYNMKSAIIISGIVALINLAGCGSSLSSPVKETETLLAIFAHPDDELLMGATLAHYASAGIKVYVVIATDGALGTTDFAKIPAGEALVKVRHEEMICSAKALGIQPPIFIGLSDQLDSKNGGVPAQLDSLRKAVTSLITSLKPKVIVTFGAEGWTGHPDHRLIGNIVTEVFASRKWTGNPKLYYTGLPTGVITDSSWAQYLTVDSSYLTVRVPLAATDYEKTRLAFDCHQSQYRESVRKKLPVFHEETEKRTAMFRPFVQDGIKNSLFDSKSN